MIDTIRNALELLYFCSAIVLAVVAVIGLRQLKISKENTLKSIEIAKTSAQRDAFRLAAEQCAHYFTYIVPLFNQFDKWIAENKSKGVINAVDIKITAAGMVLEGKNASAIKDYVNFVGTEPERFVAVMNATEGFSIMFSAGVASEEVAFSSIGYTFCGSVKSFLPGMLLLGGKTHFQHSLRLFYIWSKRIERQQLLESQKEMEKRITEMTETGVRPIGT
jgi:hypothetical protein